jgi:hypothetical protein
LPLKYRPRTICGRDVMTTKIRLVESEDHPIPSCPECFSAHVRRLHGLSPSGTDQHYPKWPLPVISLTVPILAALLLLVMLAPSLDDVTPVQGLPPDTHEMAQVPAKDGNGPLSDDAKGTN